MDNVTAYCNTRIIEHRAIVKKELEAIIQATRLSLSSLEQRPDDGVFALEHDRISRSAMNAERAYHEMMTTIRILHQFNKR